MMRIVKILIALELAVVMFGIYILTNTYHVNMRDYDKIKNFPYTGIYFSTFQDHTYGSFYKIKGEIENHPKFCGWSYMQDKMIGEEDFILSFDPMTSELFSMDVQKGKWFGEVKEREEIVPCVIVDNEKRNVDVGDTLTLDGTDYVVTGIVSSEEEFFCIADSYGNSSTYVLSELKTGLLPVEYRTIICASEAEPEYDDMTSVIAYFDKSLSEKEMSEIEKIMKHEGTTETFQEMKQVTYQESYYKVMEYIPFCVLFFFSSIMGVITVSVINSRKMIRKYGIFALYGGHWGQIVFEYFRELFLLAVFMSVLAAVYAYHAGIYYGNVFYINALISLIYALLGAGFLHLMKGKRNIIACIRV